ncbi:MAG: serine--tRNA ligase [bacterium JZ-2024 1]
MIDLRRLRADPDRYRLGFARKRVSVDVTGILALDEKRRALLTEVEELRARSNTLAKKVGEAMRSGQDTELLLAESRETRDRINQLEKELQVVEADLEKALLELPNLPLPEVPDGAGEEENRVLREWGKKRVFRKPPRPHWEIGEELDIIDFKRGTKLSGARFYVLKGLGSALERALISFMLEVHTKQHGYLEIFPPFLVKPDCLVGTGQLPKFAEDLYYVPSDELYLEPTAEVPVTNLHRDEILEERVLPLKYASYTACFRREAGAAGKDTRGVIRVHQFNKVELVKFTTPETSMDEFYGLLGDAESILRALALPYRVVQMCTGDLGFAAAIKIDLEVWMPGQNRYVEVSSVSNFLDFQARRANIRFRRTPESKPEFVHTMNGSGLAIGRTLAAVLENYQEENGSVRIPEPLRSYVGAEEIVPAHK